MFTNGCFDILHVGHIQLLQRCRKLGDVLVVGLNDDASVRALKGENRPLIGQADRAHVMAALDAVDYVTLFPEPTPMALIEALRPDVLVKGGDYAIDEVVGRDFVESYGGHVELVPDRRRLLDHRHRAPHRRAPRALTVDSPRGDAWLRNAACVDLRDAAACAAERPVGAVRLTVDDLLHRPYLLPPRSRPLVLVGGPSDALRLVVEALGAAGHADVRHLPEEAWRAQLPAETGPPSRTRLWEPSPALVEALKSHPLPEGRAALDLASGSGRNAVYLALEGWDATAVDVLPDALERVRDLAARSGVGVHTARIDLTFPGALDELRADLVVVVRYLERTLFGPLQRVLRPGGLLVYETFTTDQAEVGHPRNPRFLLQPGELRTAFPDLELVSYREGFFEGAHLARLVARAPA